MGIKVVKQPEREPLTLEEAKLHLRIDTEEEDDLIRSLITQARQWCENYQGRKYLKQTVEVVLNGFPREKFIEFRTISPVTGIEKIEYTTIDGVKKEINENSYILDSSSFISKIVLKENVFWPSERLQEINGIKIKLTAGEEEVEETIKWAMVIHMRMMYDDLKPEEKKQMRETRDSILSMNRVIPV